MPDPAALTTADFAPFYRAVHGYDPFPWQQDLTDQVLDRGRWPDLIDVPTGLGKTSMLDIALFVAAATADQPGSQRLGRRRCFFVVDRRIVVDEAYDHARQLTHAVQHAEQSGETGVLGRVAAGLRTYTPAQSGALVPVTRMRGGTTWASAWLDRPDRPGIVLGTVDQIGSRLLFRGYGVSDRRRPIDAALVGTDALILLDEAHLSTPLLTTLAAVQQRDQLGLPLPGLRLVRLSATAGHTHNPFQLDLDANRHSPVAWRRLNAAKTLSTRATTAKKTAAALADAALAALRALSSDHAQAPVAAVVCNTVDRAREVHTLLRRQLAADPAYSDTDCELLIGRARPIDRPDLQARILDRFGTHRGPSTRTAILVATQTVEVGINIDLDALITESASWDALVQRLGRLNRLGHFTDRFPGHPGAPAIVVHDQQPTSPIYGQTGAHVWTALHTISPGGGLDVSPLACRELTDTVFTGAEYQRQPAGVPVLLRPTLDAWAQTSPIPLHDPPIQPFLHGFNSGPAAVQMAWRAGLPSPDPRDSTRGVGHPEPANAQIDELLTLMPPHAPELVEVPLRAVRQWMRGYTPSPVSDLESDDAADRPRTPRRRDPFLVLTQRPVTPGRRGQHTETPTVWSWVDADQLRPGDQIVIPAERGGLDTYGWAPRNPASVPDVSEIATFLARPGRQAKLRLDRDLPTRLGLADIPHQAVTDLLRDLRGRDEAITPNGIGHALAPLLPGTPAAGWPAAAWTALQRWVISGQLTIIAINNSTEATDAGDAVVRLLVGPLPSNTRTNPGEFIERDDDEVAASSISRKPVTLTAHHASVRRRAEEIADALGLPAELRTVIADAAQWHDLGKIEERFQAMLHGDSLIAALALEPLAKSDLDPADRLAWRRSRHLSGLPAGLRHEAWSAALINEHLLNRDPRYAGDTDLLIHLIASHHGYARPLAPLIADPQPRTIEALIDDDKCTVQSDRTVSLEHPGRFARLNDRYGRWGLALLETVIRSADMTISQEGS
jgi:CRISPR-associated endonuclease/helicase Cas3